MSRKTFGGYPEINKKTPCKTEDYVTSVIIEDLPDRDKLCEKCPFEMETINENERPVCILEKSMKEVTT